MSSLEIISGRQCGAVFPLANRPLSVGRDPARDIQVLDPKVSRRHFIVRRSGPDYVLVPFRSLNGVYLNGRYLEGEVVLRHDDIISIGDTTLRFDDSSRSAGGDGLNCRKAADRRFRERSTIEDSSLAV